MKTRWGIPELDELPKAEAKAIWRRAVAKAMRRPRFWAVIGLVELALSVFFMAVYQVRHYVPMPKFMSDSLWGYTGGVLGAYLAFRLLKPLLGATLRPYVWQELKDRCHGCGYNLFGNVSGVCPECGTPIQVKAKP